MLKYQVIVDDLISKIDSGHYPANTKLPTIPELCETYGVSKITIKKVMDELEGLGAITRRRGAGTFVKCAPKGFDRPRVWNGPSGLEGTKTTYEARGYNITSKIIEFEIAEPDEHVAKALDMNEGFVYRIIRARFIDGEPFGIEYTYMPIELIPGVTNEVLNDSIYQYIGKKLGLTIDSAHSSLRAVLPTDDECAWLGISRDCPLLEVVQTAFLSDGSAFEYSIVRNTNNAEAIRIVRLFHR